MKKGAGDSGQMMRAGFEPCGAPAARMRKEPRQARSVATVEAIIEAGARVLSEIGWAGFSTNKVAEAAGDLANDGGTVIDEGGV